MHVRWWMFPIPRVGSHSIDYHQPCSRQEQVSHCLFSLELNRCSSEGIFPSPYVYPKNMKLRESKRGLQKQVTPASVMRGAHLCCISYILCECGHPQVPESWGSDHYEANVAGRQAREHSHLVWAGCGCLLNARLWMPSMHDPVCASQEEACGESIQHFKVS